MRFAVPRFAAYRPLIERLPNSVEKRHIQVPKFCIGREGRLAVYYAPFEAAVDPEARIMIVGLTPGWTQTKIAYDRCHAVLKTGGSRAAAVAAVSCSAPFAGMRGRLCRWLDDLGVYQWLRIDGAASLFDDRRRLVHATSLVRYPVFVGEKGENYRGSGRQPIQSELLRAIIETVLVPQLHALPDALIVPLGVTVAGALRELGVPRSRCLYGFPHPSRAYPYGELRFSQRRRAMRGVVSRLP